MSEQITDERAQARDAACRQRNHDCDYPGCGDRNFRAGFDAGADWQMQVTLPQFDALQAEINHLESEVADLESEVERLSEKLEDW